MKATKLKMTEGTEENNTANKVSQFIRCSILLLIILKWLFLFQPHIEGAKFENVKNYLEKEEENDILGSGNFYIGTGGTFYIDDDDPYRSR
jgi:hypothetical protein